MLKIQCPKCNKSFIWTDDMPTEGKCPAQGCSWQYNIHQELGRNISMHEGIKETETLKCSFCKSEITSKFTVCSHCGHVVLGDKSLPKSYFFLAVCVFLFLLSVIFKYGVT